MKRISVALIAIAVALVGSTAFASPARAEGASDDLVVCAAVHPCNEDGSVQTPFNQGACAEHYALECAKDAFDRESDGSISCNTDRENLGQQVKRLTKLLRMERKKNRQAH